MNQMDCSDNLDTLLGHRMIVWISMLRIQSLGLSLYQVILNLMSILKIIIALLIICIIIVAHEFGHYIIAVANGITVKEFFVGVGPNIFTKKKGDTVYSLKCWQLRCLLFARWPICLVSPQFFLKRSWRDVPRVV